MMAPRHPTWHFCWVVTCLVLVVAAQEGAKKEDPPNEEEPVLKEVTTTKEDVYLTDRTEPLNDKTKAAKPVHKKAPPQNTTWQEDTNNAVLRREGIPAIKPPPKELKNIIKGRHLGEPSLGGLNFLNETTTGAPKFRRKKRPNRVQSATEMSLPATSTAWALASLITTPREKLTPLHGPVKPFIQWSTILVGSSTTETTPQAISKEMEEPLSTVASSVTSQIDRSSHSNTISPTSQPVTKPAITTSSESPTSPQETIKTTITSTPSTSTTEVQTVVTEATNKSVSSTPQTAVHEETLVIGEQDKAEKPATTTELDNAINKSEGEKKSSNIIERTPDTWDNSVSDTNKTSKTIPPVTTVAPESTSHTTSSRPNDIPVSVLSTSVATTSPRPTTIPATTDATSPATVSPPTTSINNNTEFIEQPDDDASKNITLNLITPHPTTHESSASHEGSVEKEFPSPKPTNTTSIPEVSESPSNYTKIDFIINFDNETSTTLKPLTATNPVVVSSPAVPSTTPQPKEYNEILPFSEIFKEPSEKTPDVKAHETVSTSETPVSDYKDVHSNFTIAIHDDSNIIETPDIFEEPPKQTNNTVDADAINSVNSTGDVISETVTYTPTVENTTAKVIGTLYTVNKTVHITTKGPTSTFENGLLNFNDSYPQHPKIDESDDISEDIDEKILETIQSSDNFSKIPEEVFVGTTAAPPVIINPSTTISPVLVPSSTTPKDGNEDNSQMGDGYHIYDLETTMVTRLLIQASVITVCQNIEELRTSILKLLQNETRDIDRKQIVINAPDSQACMAGISPREDNLVPVEIFMTDKNGESDNALTDNFISLWRRDGLDFPYAVKKVEKFIGRGKWTRYGERETNSTMAAIIISVTAGVCLLLITILLVIIRKRHKGFSYGQRCTPVSLEDYSLDNISVYNSVRRKGARASKRSYGNPAFDDPGAISHVLNFATLASFVNNRVNIDEEFTQVPTVSVKPDELPPGVDGKNRFANVIPIPETRVPLPEAKPGTDKDTYINANFVKGAKGEEKFFIACQAPLKETVSDFWKMIWHHQCRLVIMLTELQEGGVEKSADYLPPSEVLDCHRVFNGLQVTLKKREVREKYIISSLQLKNLETNSWREVVHMWYVAWPHQGVPDEASSIIALLIEARSYIKSKENSSPVVIHCSPGTGRTGTIIAIDICIRDFEIKRAIDVPKTVYNIRKDRAGAVQTKDQYAFIYQVLHLYATKLTGGGLDSI